MRNPLLDSLRNNSGSSMPQINQSQMQSVRNIINMIKSSNNPDQAFQNLVNQNPNMKQFMTMLNGTDAKTMFYQLCQQNNIDPNIILSQLNG